MRSAVLTREETAARSAHLRVGKVRVALDLSSAPDAEKSGFGTVTTLHFESDVAETWLDFIGIAVHSVTVNGEPREVDWDGARIRIRGLLKGSNVVEVRAEAAYSRSGEGLHRFTDPADGATYLYTQYEPADSRRVMACFEQPDLKARWTFVVTAPAGWRVLSNSRPESRTVSGGIQTVTFAETLPLSSYITAIAAGPYHRVESTAKSGATDVPLAVYCRASLAEHLDPDEIVEITRQGLEFFTEAFGVEYPWGGYDQIFVPEYNLGAMENPGLVTFTEAYVFRGAATQAQREGRANTILHEMAHMWFGDLVTMTWWDDLWLKESFADYMGSHASVAATRFTDAWAAFANRRKAWAYQADQLPTTHPIVADIPDLEAAKLNFDGITYAKGASVLKQLVAYVGEEEFFAGARRYFADHAYGNTTLVDLLRALSGASGRDLDEWARVWLQTTGMSTLRLVRRGGDEVEIHQDDSRPHRLKLGLYRSAGGTLERTAQVPVEIDQPTTVLAVPGAADADLLLLNDGDDTYAKVRLDDRSLDAVAEGLGTLIDPLTRGLLWSALWNATRDGELPVARYLAAVHTHAPGELNTALLSGVLDNASYAAGHYLDGDERDTARRGLLELTWKQVFAASGTDRTLVWARALAEVAGYDDHHAVDLRALLDGSMDRPVDLPLDPDLRWAWWTALATTGHAGAAELGAEAATDPSSHGKTALIRALAARPDARVRAEAWRSIRDGALTNDHLSATITGFTAGDSRELISDFDEEYFATLEQVWADHSIELARRMVVGLFPQQHNLTAVDEWLTAHPAAPGALRRLVLERRDHLARDLRVRAAQPR